MSSSKDKNTKVIEVKELFADHSQRLVLKGINLSIEQGDIHVLMGTSGAGKSTLLRTLLGLHKPLSGHISVMGVDMVKSSKKRRYQLRRSLGVAFQDGALFDDRNLIENIELPLIEHTNLDRNTIRIMARMKLKMFDLLDVQYALPAELTAGEKKRSSLARAVVMDPQLLFFDEPSIGLDPIVAAEIDQYLVALRQSLNLTIVVVTHDRESAFRIADNISIIDDGQVVVSGSPDELLRSGDERIKNLLLRRSAGLKQTPEEYLNTLTGVEKIPELEIAEQSVSNDSLKAKK